MSGVTNHQKYRVTISLGENTKKVLQLVANGEGRTSSSLAAHYVREGLRRSGKVVVRETSPYITRRERRPSR